MESQVNQSKDVRRLVVGIDASRNRSGGARTHVIGILSSLVPERHGIREVHVWGFRSLLDAIPNRAWLVKHSPPELAQSLTRQLWWQAVHLSRQANAVHCDILFTTDASTLCRFKPMVVLSQDMLSYEPGVMEDFKWGYARLRLLAILHLQNAAFRGADGVIFLTRYAGEVIQRSCGPLRRVRFIPHGVGEAFKRARHCAEFPSANDREVRCLYISPISRYKYQWVVVQAVERLRQQGLSIRIDLVGNEDNTGKDLLERQIALSDPAGTFVHRHGATPQDSLPACLANAHVFVFASTCENLPVTLLEAMAVGVPIACSDRGPMPEVLQDAGVYFDPEDAESIARAIERIATDAELRVSIAGRARQLAGDYSWKRCADETFAFIAETHRLSQQHCQ